MVSTFLKCHFKVECLMTFSFSPMYISGGFPQHKPANITHSRLIYCFYSTRCYMGLATLAMLLSIMTLHLVLDDANVCNEFTGTSREYFIPSSPHEESRSSPILLVIQYVSCNLFDFFGIFPFPECSVMILLS